ncbi:MAG: preprotein translocase subunit YajC [Micrococcus sp.]|nr:preprotein translocase subunit YajC [Micrococcus sp.]
MDPFLLMMFAILALLLFFTFRRGRKAQQEQTQMRESLAPGVEVMTGAGIFGTVRSLDMENQRVTLEVSPATYMDVHLQAIARVDKPESAVAGATTGSSAAVHPGDAAEAQRLEETRGDAPRIEGMRTDDGGEAPRENPSGSAERP